MRNGTKFTPGSSLLMEKEETERGGVRIPRKKREKKENLDVRRAGIFVECVSRITGSYQYALTPRYTMKKLERIRIRVHGNPFYEKRVISMTDMK